MNRYDVLGVKSDALPGEIKKAYLKLVAKTHPDVADAVMTPLFLSVQDAYETLSDPGKRAAYDREIGSARPAPPQPEPSAPSTPRPEPRQARYEQADKPQQREPGAQATAAPSGRDVKMRRIKIGAVIAFFVGLGGYWLFQEIQLWQLVQAKNSFRMYTAPGVPAGAYAVLWAFGTIIASVADGFYTTWLAPLVCGLAAGGFAFITATGNFEIWLPALITGLVLTFAIALAVRLRST